VPVQGCSLLTFPKLPLHGSSLFLTSSSCFYFSFEISACPMLTNFQTFSVQFIPCIIFIGIYNMIIFMMSAVLSQ
jgi:hypothetical protein